MNWQNKHISDFPEIIVNEWFDKGKKEDVVFKFICYWIAFNHLYNYGVILFDPPYEKNRIRKYCTKNMDTLLSDIDFEKLDLSEFYKSPVLPGSATIEEDESGDPEINLIKRITKALSEGHRRTEKEAGDIAYDFCALRGEDKREKIIALFMEMYRVRCNLFHGDKRPSSNRDLLLVEQSGEVLQMCLPGLIEKTFGRFNPREKDDNNVIE